MAKMLLKVAKAVCSCRFGYEFTHTLAFGHIRGLLFGLEKIELLVPKEKHIFSIWCFMVCCFMGNKIFDFTSQTSRVCQPSLKIRSCSDISNLKVMSLVELIRNALAPYVFL